MDTPDADLIDMAHPNVSTNSITACVPDVSSARGSEQQTVHPVAVAQPLLVTRSAHLQLR